MSRFYLKQNWDQSHTWDSKLKDGVFIETETVKKLKEFLIERNSGSLLISGQRGAGKSTAVINSIKKIQTINQKLIPVYINAIELEAISGEGEYFLESIKIVKQLAFAFRSYLESHRRKIPSKLKELLTILEFSEILRTYHSGSNQEVGLQASLRASMAKDFFSGSSDAGVKLKHFLENETFAKKIGITIEEIIRDFLEIIEKVELQQQPIINKFIDRIPVLLNCIYKKSIKHKKPFSREKVVFILDELDYFDEDEKEIDNVLQTLKRLKSLFTLSEAQFIFIVGVQTYKKSLPDLKNKYFHTVFTDRLFFYKPSGTELIEYLKSIDHEEKSNDQELLWEKFHWLLVSKSRHSFYLLKQEIKSASSYIEDGNQRFIELERISRDDEKRACLHFALNSIYELKLQKQNSYQYNEILYDKLYEIESSFIKFISGANHPDTLMNFVSGIEDLDPELHSIILSAQRDFLSYLLLLTKQGTYIESIRNGTTAQIDWNEIGRNLEWENVKRGIEGPILEEEINFLNSVEKIIDLIEKMVPSKETLSLQEKFKKSIVSFSTFSKIEVDMQNVESVEKAIIAINNKKIFYRDLLLTEEASRLTNEILHEVRNVQSNGKNIFLKTEWGSAVYSEGKLSLFKDPTHNNKFSTRVTILPKLKKDSDFTLTFEAFLEEGSLLNILLITSESTNSEVDDEFFMLRLETRIGEHIGIRDGILEKKANLSWNLVRQDIITGRTVPRRWVMVRVKANKGTLFFQKKKKSGFVTIESIKIPLGIKYIGLANELEATHLRKINLF